VVTMRRRYLRSTSIDNLSDGDVANIKRSDVMIKIKILFNGPVRQLNGWKNVANIELPDGATGYDLCDYFNIIPGKTRLYGFLIRDGKKIKEEEELHDGETIKVNGKTSGG